MVSRSRRRQGHDPTDRRSAAWSPRISTGFEDANGCPELDNDGDKISTRTTSAPSSPRPRRVPRRGRLPRARQRCRHRAGHHRWLSPDRRSRGEQGCPWPDRDGDTVNRSLDNCPTSPVRSSSGLQCQGSWSRSRRTGSSSSRRCFFQTNKAVIPAPLPQAPRQRRHRDQEPPGFSRSRSMATPDDRGSDAFNLKLSQSRAAAAGHLSRQEGGRGDAAVVRGIRRAVPHRGEQPGEGPRRQPPRRVHDRRHGRDHRRAADACHPGAGPDGARDRASRDQVAGRRGSRSAIRTRLRG